MQNIKNGTKKLWQMELLFRGISVNHCEMECDK